MSNSSMINPHDILAEIEKSFSRGSRWWKSIADRDLQYPQIRHFPPRYSNARSFRDRRV